MTIETATSCVLRLQKGGAFQASAGRTTILAATFSTHTMNDYSAEADTPSCDDSFGSYGNISAHDSFAATSPFQTALSTPDQFPLSASERGRGCPPSTPTEAANGLVPETLQGAFPALSPCGPSDSDRHNYYGSIERDLQADLKSKMVRGILAILSVLFKLI